jgi:hypothetical protein
MSVKSNETTKGPRIVPTLDMKLKMEITIFQYVAPCSPVENYYDSEADKRAENIGRVQGIPLTTVQTTVSDKQKHKDVPKVAEPGTLKYLRIRENTLLKMEKLLI